MKFLKQGSYIRYVLEKLSKFVQIITDLHHTDDSLKIKKSLELVPRPHFLLQYYIKLFIKICLVFHAWAFDNIMTFQYLKT